METLEYVAHATPLKLSSYFDIFILIFFLNIVSMTFLIHSFQKHILPFSQTTVF